MHRRVSYEIYRTRGSFYVTRVGYRPLWQPGEGREFCRLSQWDRRRTAAPRDAL